MPGISINDLAKKLKVQPKLILRMVESLGEQMHTPEDIMNDDLTVVVTAAIKKERAERRAANAKKKAEAAAAAAVASPGADQTPATSDSTEKKPKTPRTKKPTATPAEKPIEDSTPSEVKGREASEESISTNIPVAVASNTAIKASTSVVIEETKVSDAAASEPARVSPAATINVASNAANNIAPTAATTSGPAPAVNSVARPAPRPANAGTTMAGPAPAMPAASRPMQGPAPRQAGPAMAGPQPRPSTGQGPAPRQAGSHPGARPQGSGNVQNSRPQGTPHQGQGSRPYQGQGAPRQGQQGSSAPRRDQGQGQNQGFQQRPQGQGNRPGGFTPRDGQGQGRPSGQGQARPGGQGARPGGAPGQTRPGGSGGGRPSSGTRSGGPFIPQPQQTEKATQGSSKMVKKDLKYSDERYRDQERIFSSEGEREQQRDTRRPRGGSRRGAQSRPAAEPRSNTQIPSQIELAGSITVKGLADLLKTDGSTIIKALMRFGMLVSINQEIDIETATIVTTELGSKVVAPKEAFQLESIVVVEEDEEEDLLPRAPVVTVMGHVDHGKTSLLDAIRSADVASGEAGGITQHIGAYIVDADGRKITFLDTPGHAAFTAMRARGAQVTDIAILVVAADDGVMPQTIEAINHAKAANVPIIVAINKIDKPGANPDRVKQELTEYELIAEEWGGDVIMVPVSAIRGDGISELLESVLLVADIAELTANPNRRAVGTVIEAKLDRGRGPVATVLVHKGTLNIGDVLVVGTTYGKVRAMIDDKGKRVKKAGPSQPVEVVGLNGVPEASDSCNAVADERQARQLAEERAVQRKAEEQMRSGGLTLDDWMKISEVKELNLILKGDVHGSLEAIRLSLEKLSTAEVRVSIVHTGVGAISESDVMLATASNAIIIGFNVRPDVNSSKMAEKEKIDIRTYRVIYDIINDVEAALKGLLAPVIRENVIAHIEVREVFHISRIGNIAGCYVTDGRVNRNAMIRVIRDGTVIHECKIDSLKRLKDDVREVNSGYECGILLERFNDVKIGDRFEAYVIEEIKRTEL